MTGSGRCVELKDGLYAERERGTYDTQGIGNQQ